MNFLARFLGFALFLGACQSQDTLNATRVLEQSRRERPAWVEEPEVNGLSQGTLINYHLVKARVLDLPLGLRQAESSAVNDTKLKIENELQALWLKDRAYQGLEAADRLTLMRYLQKLLNERVNSALIRDIYYEKIFDSAEPMNLQETYAIHILIQWPRVAMREILRDLRYFCRNSLRQNLINLSRNDQIFLAQP